MNIAHSGLWCLVATSYRLLQDQGTGRTPVGEHSSLTPTQRPGFHPEVRDNDQEAELPSVVVKR